MGHSSYVTCVKVHCIHRDEAPVMISGSSDGNIKVWEISTGQCLKTFDCRFPISCLHAEKELLVVAGCKRENRTSEKGCLKLWNIEKGKCVKDFSSYGLVPLAAVYLSGLRLMTVESGWMSFRCRKFRKTGAIKLWDVQTGCVVQTVVDFQMKDATNKSQCVVSLLVDKNYNIIVGIEEMEHIKPSAFSHIFKIKSMVKVWSLKEAK